MPRCSGWAPGPATRRAMENGEFVGPVVPEFAPGKPLSKAARKNVRRREKAANHAGDAGEDVQGTADEIEPVVAPVQQPPALQQPTEKAIVERGSDGVPECEFWRSMGRCKFGASCRFRHGETLACLCANHPHTLGPGIGAAALRQKAFCDACNAKTKGGWRCTAGCDFVLCASCLELHRMPSPPPTHAEEPESAAAAAMVVEREGAAAASSAAAMPSAASPALPGDEPSARLHYVRGDATVAMHGPRGFKVIAHVCNDLGRWGKGFVMAVSDKWPEVATRYRQWHRSGEEGGFRLGRVQLVPLSQPMCAHDRARAALAGAPGGLAVANIIGQHGIKRSSSGPPVRYEAIAEGLLQVGVLALQAGLEAGPEAGARAGPEAGPEAGPGGVGATSTSRPSVHMPRIGAGLAGGDWAAIEPLILRMLAASPGLEAYVYDWDG